MMTEEEYQEFLEALRGLLVGATVERVDAGDGREHWFTLTVTRPGESERVVELWATDLGAWLQAPGAQPGTPDTLKPAE